MTGIEGAVVLVTGSNRGIGRALVDELIARGAAKVYATTRGSVAIDHPAAVSLTLDVTDPKSVAAAAQRSSDVTVLINNAGTARAVPFLNSSVDDIRAEFETNFYGPLHTTRAWAPVIADNGGGHILNMHSLLSWHGQMGSYSASKAALWSQTNSLRLELLEDGIRVTGVHVGYVDTDMTVSINADKLSPAEVARIAIDGIEADEPEVLVDDMTRILKSKLSQPLSEIYPQLTYPEV